MKKNRFRKTPLIWATAIGAIMIFIMEILWFIVSNFIIVSNAKGKVFDDIDSLNPVKVGLLFSTISQDQIEDKENLLFKYRVEAAEELYKAGKIEYVFICSNGNKNDDTYKSMRMKDSLIAHGIPREMIFIDKVDLYSLMTYVELSKQMGANASTIISQRRHNERVIYVAEHMAQSIGLEIENLQAYNAKEPSGTMSIVDCLKEYYIRSKCVF